MGRRGGRKGGRGHGAFGRGGGPCPRQDTRSDKRNIERENQRFEEYYDYLGLVPSEEKEEFWEAMRRDLPNSFRFTGSKAHALAVQQRLRDFYIPEITSITHEGGFVKPPQPVKWYPDHLAWFMTTPKQVIRRFPPFASFQKFLVAETDVGNINRQEIVSMIPPLVMDLRPGMTVLDMCAAPGSKSAQLIEMIHAGEEERAREVASRFTKGLDRPEGEEFNDDGRSTGLLVANDVDYKRAHMLVHQMKRLSSPNIIVTNHDATVYPSIKIPSMPAAEGKPVQNRYLKFDRILADVPCSGDGTPRKNIEIWKNWNPGNGLGLHMTQVRILIRALQMLKVGGRVVYSTCSMNPVEDEAVIATAIDRCGGPNIVEILETKDYLPGLERYPGMLSWSIMDKTGRIWDNYDAILKHRADVGEGAWTVFKKQDTGAFFIAILQKKSEIKARSEEKPNMSSESVKVEVADSNGTVTQLEPSTNDQFDASVSQSDDKLEEGNLVKRKRSFDDIGHGTFKRQKSEEVDTGQNRETESRTAVNGTENGSNGIETSTTADESIHKQVPIALEPDPYRTKRKARDQPFEEPFKYLDPSSPELEQIRNFYNLSERFPQDRFMVRNAQVIATRNIYYTTALAKSILQENEGKGLKFVHSGVKMFVKQDAPSPDVCPWRIQTDGLRILETWVGKERIVRLTKKETLRKLLNEMFPRFANDEWKNLGEIGEQVLPLKMGCCVLVVEPSDSEDGLPERMVFPLWKSIQSLNLMLPKEERRAMLLRLFNDNTPLVNLSQGWIKKTGGQAADLAQTEKILQEEKAEQEDERKEIGEGLDRDLGSMTAGYASVSQEQRRNSSSPELADDHNEE